MKKLPKINTAKLLKAALPYIFIGLMATKLGQAYRMVPEGDVLDKALGALLNIGTAFQNPFPSFHPFDLMVGAACGVLIWFIVYQKAKNARKYRRGAEYGTARWGTAKDIEPFIDPDFSQNILLSDTERLTLGKIADPEKRNVNLNVLVIGGSGSGKTRYHIKPNLLQMNASYICSDPKGTVIEEVGRAMVRGGYKIKVLNTIDFACSMHYNPFVYLHSETDILTLVTVIMTNTQGDAKGGDDFWQKAEALLYQALIAYIYYEAPAEEKNMNTLLDMLNACECREDDENFKSAVDLLFEQLENRNPDHFAVRQYKKFKMAAGKTLKRTINQQRSVDHVDTPTEALAVSIGEKATVDLSFMAELLDRPGRESEIAAELSGVIFQNPEKSHGDALAGWETADEYLSGNVRKKLEAAREAADRDPAFAVNVSALEKSQPKELGAAEIDVRIDATWIDPSYYTQFIYELLKTPGRFRGDTIAARYSATTGEWNVSGKGRDSDNNTLMPI